MNELCTFNDSTKRLIQSVTFRSCTPFHVQNLRAPQQGLKNASLQLRDVWKNRSIATCCSTDPRTCAAQKQVYRHLMPYTTTKNTVEQALSCWPKHTMSAGPNHALLHAASCERVALCTQFQYSCSARHLYDCSILQRIILGNAPDKHEHM